MSQTRVRLTPLGKVFAPIFVLLAIVGAAWFTARVIWPIVLFVLHNFEFWSGPAFYLFFGLCVAFLLAIIRGWSQRFYGSVEIVLASAALAATAAMLPSKDPASAIIGYVGSVYFLMRGFVNVWETLSFGKRQFVRGWFYTDSEATTRP